MAKHIIQLVISTAQIVGKAFTKALRQEINYSREAAQRAGGGRQGQKTATQDMASGMTLQEALQILNVKDTSDVELIQKRFDQYFKLNDKTTGGTLYIQSKIFRAKERLDAEIKNKASKEEPTDKPEREHPSSAS